MSLREPAYFNQQNCNKIETITTEIMLPSNQNTPIIPSKNSTPSRNQRVRKFMRKPAQNSERSSSKKSFDTISVKDNFIRSPRAIKINNPKQEDFFVSLASSIIKTNKASSDKKPNFTQKKGEPTDRTSLTEFEDRRFETNHYHDNSEVTIRNLGLRVKTLQAQLDLKNHQASILSSECQRLKKSLEDEKQKRRSIENQKKQLSKQLKQITKQSQVLKLQLKKIEKQREHLIKQIQFFDRINYDDKTRSLQSYRETYLEEELQKIRKQFHKSRGQRQLDLENQIRVLKQQKYTIQSHMKAIKLANQCLIKQINNNQESLHDIILNSDEYVKLRDKYVRFLEEYKLLRSQYWALKAQSHDRKGTKSEQSQIFSITASEVQNDLSELKGTTDTTQILKYITVPNTNQPEKKK